PASVADPRQRVVLGEEGHPRARPPAAYARHERRRQAGDPGANLEAGGPQDLLQPSGRAGLLHAQLGVIVEVLAERHEVATETVEGGPYRTPEISFCHRGSPDGEGASPDRRAQAPGQ